MIHRSFRRLALPMAVAAIALASGCGPRMGTVSGQVLFDRKPLPGGIVSFLPTQPGRNPVSSLIEDGHYTLNVPAGEYQISVDNRELEARSHKRPPPQAPPGIKVPPAGKVDAPPHEKAAGPPGKYVPIPEKYYRGESSELTCTVTGGPQEHNIELKQP